MLNRIWPAARAAMAGVAMIAAGVGTAAAQVAAPGTVAMNAPAAKDIAPSSFATYDNKWQVYGGLIYANGQAGQDIPSRHSMGGAEVEATYWLGSKPVKTWGAAVDYRYLAGTSQTGNIGAAYGLNRILVLEQGFTGGVEYRTPFHNRYVGVDAHAMAGGVYGVFDHALTHYPGYPGPGSPPIVACPAEVTATKPNSLGMYCNGVSPYAFAGVSFDFNDTRKLAIRFQPDMTFEHFGSETREFFSMTLGIMYRFGNPKIVPVK